MTAPETHYRSRRNQASASQSRESTSIRDISALLSAVAKPKLVVASQDPKAYTWGAWAERKYNALVERLKRTGQKFGKQALAIDGFTILLSYVNGLGKIVVMGGIAGEPALFLSGPSTATTAYTVTYTAATETTAEFITFVPKEIIPGGATGVSGSVDISTTTGYGPITWIDGARLRNLKIISDLQTYELEGNAAHVAAGRGTSVSRGETRLFNGAVIEHLTRGTRTSTRNLTTTSIYTPQIFGREFAGDKRLLQISLPAFDAYIASLPNGYSLTPSGVAISQNYTTESVMYTRAGGLFLVVHRVGNNNIFIPDAMDSFHAELEIVDQSGVYKLSEKTSFVRNYTRIFTNTYSGAGVPALEVSSRGAYVGVIVQEPRSYGVVNETSAPLPTPITLMPSLGASTTRGLTSSALHNTSVYSPLEIMNEFGEITDNTFVSWVSQYQLQQYVGGVAKTLVTTPAVPVYDFQAQATRYEWTFLPFLDGAQENAILFELVVQRAVSIFELVADGGRERVVSIGSSTPAGSYSLALKFFEDGVLAHTQSVLNGAYGAGSISQVVTPTSLPPPPSGRVYTRVCFLPTTSVLVAGPTTYICGVLYIEEASTTQPAPPLYALLPTKRDTRVYAFDVTTKTLFISQTARPQTGTEAPPGLQVAPRGDDVFMIWHNPSGGTRCVSLRRMLNGLPDEVPITPDVPITLVRFAPNPDDYGAAFLERTAVKAPRFRLTI